jgi:hypothetical protein
VKSLWKRRRRTGVDAPAPAALAASSGWAWPSWLHVDADGTVRTDPVPWRRTGSLGAPHRALVDPSGTVVPRLGAAALEWWVRGPDGWIRPGDVAERTQADVAGTPVWETAIPLAGPVEGPGAGFVGRVAQRVYGVGGAPRRVAVAVGNESGAPVAVAFVLRPCGPDGVVAVRDVDVDGATVTVDGRPYLQLPHGTPHRFVTSTATGGDVTGDIASPERRLDAGVHDPDGLASFAVVYPLEHGAVVHVALLQDAVAGDVPDVAAVERSDAVVRGWRRQTDDAARWTLPDNDAERFMARRPADLLLALDACDGTDRIVVARALLALGAASQVATWWAGRCAEDRVDLSALVIAADCWGATRDRALVRDRLTQIEHAAFPAAEARGDDTPLACAALAAAAELAAAAGADELEGSLDGLVRTFVADGVAPFRPAPPDVAAVLASITAGTAEDDAVAAALGALALRDAVVCDASDDAADELVLFGALPEAWADGDVAVTGAPTRFGRVDLRLTREGTTSVLQWRGLWGATEPRLRAPSLSADWSTTDPAGLVTFASP